MQCLICIWQISCSTLHSCREREVLFLCIFTSTSPTPSFPFNLNIVYFLVHMCWLWCTHTLYRRCKHWLSLDSIHPADLRSRFCTKRFIFRCNFICSTHTHTPKSRTMYFHRYVCSLRWIVYHSTHESIFFAIDLASFSVCLLIDAIVVTCYSYYVNDMIHVCARIINLTFSVNIFSNGV